MFRESSYIYIFTMKNVYIVERVGSSIFEQRRNADSCGKKQIIVKGEYYRKVIHRKTGFHWWVLI